MKVDILRLLLLNLFFQWLDLLNFRSFFLFGLVSWVSAFLDGLLCRLLDGFLGRLHFLYHNPFLGRFCGLLLYSFFVSDLGWVVQHQLHVFFALKQSQFLLCTWLRFKCVRWLYIYSSGYVRTLMVIRLPPIYFAFKQSHWSSCVAERWAGFVTTCFFLLLWQGKL